MPDAVRGPTAVVVAAHDEAERIAATVRAATALAGIGVVIVVDDGSRDATATLARAAGARVVRHPRNRGKAAAMDTGAAVAMAAGFEVLLFLDGDLGDSAAAAQPLLGPVCAGAADLVIATLPPQRIAGGGHGFVVRLARWGITRATGFSPVQPLSGQRAMTAEAFAAARPLAYGFGVETAMTIDLLRAGMRVVEVEADLYHRVSGADWPGRRHRMRQFRHVGYALLRRAAASGRSRPSPALPRAGGGDVTP